MSQYCADCESYFMDDGHACSGIPMPLAIVTHHDGDDCPGGHVSPDQITAWEALEAACETLDRRGEAWGRAQYEVELALDPNRIVRRGTELVAAIKVVQIRLARCRELREKR